MPQGADAVIMVEDTKLVSTHKDDSGDDVEEKEVEILAQVPQGDNVRAPGSDVKSGDLVLKKGDILDSLGGEIGTLAFVGRKEVRENLKTCSLAKKYYIGGSLPQARGCDSQYG